jgi:hypothetical protein
MRIGLQLFRRANYNQKVDIFSLGIIFFECIYRFSTAMERATVLNDLRKEGIVFPQDFDFQRVLDESKYFRVFLRAYSILIRHILYSGYCSMTLANDLQA